MCHAAVPARVVGTEPVVKVPGQVRTIQLDKAWAHSVITLLVIAVSRSRLATRATVGDGNTHGGWRECAKTEKISKKGRIVLNCGLGQQIPQVKCRCVKMNDQLKVVFGREDANSRKPLDLLYVKLGHLRSVEGHNNHPGNLEFWLLLCQSQLQLQTDLFGSY